MTLAQGLPPQPDLFGFLGAHVFRLILGVIGLVGLLLAFLSLWWTSYHQRRILRRSLGHSVRQEDETSIKTWMNLRGDQLANAEQELARNPFDRPLEAVEQLGERLSGERESDQ